MFLFTGRFMTRVSLFCLLWVATNYMYIHSLRILLATDVMALFATNVACVYLLSWVILHKQFVGVRVNCYFIILFFYFLLVDKGMMSNFRFRVFNGNCLQFLLEKFRLDHFCKMYGFVTNILVL